MPLLRPTAFHSAFCGAAWHSQKYSNARVLVETACNGKEDYERLVSDEFRENTARGIVNGIEDAMAEIGVFEHEGDMYVFKEIGE